MPVDQALVIAAANAVAAIDGIEADPRTVVEDAFLLSMAFTDADEYLAAVANTVRALEQLISKTVSPAKLKHNHKEWLSYHYQHRVAQGERADLRIVFRYADDKVRLRAFGHRNLPMDFYERITESRKADTASSQEE